MEMLAKWHMAMIQIVYKNLYEISEEMIFEHGTITISIYGHDSYSFSKKH